jgi:hypothetical protein
MATFWKSFFMNPSEVQRQVGALGVYRHDNDAGNVSKFAILINRGIAGECGSFNHSKDATLLPDVIRIMQAEPAQKFKPAQRSNSPAYK